MVLAEEVSTLSRVAIVATKTWKEIYHEECYRDTLTRELTGIAEELAVTVPLYRKGKTVSIRSVSTQEDALTWLSGEGVIVFTGRVGRAYVRNLLTKYPFIRAVRCPPFRSAYELLQYLHSILLGLRAERRVADALGAAAELGFVTEVRRSTPFSEEDLGGTDIFFADRGGHIRALQVKSSETRAEEFRRHTPVIPVVVAGLGDSRASLLRKLEVLFPSLKGLTRSYKERERSGDNV